MTNPPSLALFERIKLDLSALRESDPAMLVNVSNEVHAVIEAAAFPALVAESVTDDGETFGALRCPTCGALVDEDDLLAVDVSERWTSASADGVDFERQSIQFIFDGEDNYGDTLYYLHGDEVTCVVSLPDGWRESTGM